MIRLLGLSRHVENRSKVETKEMKFRPKIDVGDYTTKKKHVLRFLEAGSKVKITIMFRGREMSHPRTRFKHFGASC